jgi:hypothetical protein
MIIAIDYDKTFSRDPRLFRAITGLIVDAGHLPICVTSRYPSEPIIKDIGLDIYYTSRQPKGVYMANQGVLVDIWIDDNPASVLFEV